MKQEQLIEAYIKNLKGIDTRLSRRLEGERGNRPQTRDVRPWRDFAPKCRVEFKDLSSFDFNRIWVWSDQHFFHNNIIRYSKRPFSDTNHMNRTMLDNYKATVGKDDVCIWVGDVTFGNTHVTNEMLGSLPGYRILVFGNHDADKGGKLRDLFFDETHAVYQIGNLIFSHYPWTAEVPSGYWNVHGHTHTENTGNIHHINVSVEQVNFTPTSLAKLIEQRGVNFKPTM